MKPQTGGRWGLSLTAHLLRQLQNKNSSLPCHDPPFPNGETEAQRGHMACPRSHRKDIKDASGGMGKISSHPHPMATRFPFQKQEYSDFLRYFRHIQAFTKGSFFFTPWWHTILHLTLIFHLRFSSGSLQINT